jgi:hypothetical protein
MSHYARWCSVCLSLVVMFAGTMGSTSTRGADFLRGDADASGRLDVTDAIRVLDYLFRGAGESLTCKDAADSNDNGQIELSDAVFLLQALFQKGGAPPEPFPFCGADPTADQLDCAWWAECPPLLEYFGIEFQAGFVAFVIDRSGTQSDSGELGKSKAATAATIDSLPDGVQFGVCFVDRSLLKFPSGGTPADANPDMRAAGVAFVQNTSGGSGSCDIPGLLAAIDMARLASSQERVIFYVGDGGGTCSGQQEADYLVEMRRAVKEANAGIARIHTVATGPITGLNEQHMKELAAENRGAFHEAPN